ncbi:MAG: hypothetical protein FJ098_12535 [Deltaproteobacteria bacterium]|nr:hypothetical protein [Deltaproteobacteria bacterium]
MKCIPVLLIVALSAACFESNPQPSPGGGGGGGDGEWREGKGDIAQPGSADVLAGPDGAAIPEEFSDGDASGAMDADLTTDVAGELAADILDITAPDAPPAGDTWPDAPSDVPDPADLVEDLAVLDTPEDAGDPEDTAIIGGGSSFGMCFGPCKTDLSLDGKAAHLVRQGWDGTIYTDTWGTLTEDGLAEAKALAVALIGVPLLDTYGCPDCADGGAKYVALRREGLSSTHAYEFSAPPEPLKDADAFVFAVVDALLSCTPGSLVTPVAGCVPGT